MRLTIVGLLFVIIFFSACENDFDLTEGKVDIPIVYAILSPLDTAHYIRLERAFSDPERSPFEIAQIPDSLYYPNPDVRLYRSRGRLEFSLQKVDGNLEGYVRQKGAFAQSPNILYKIRQSQINLQPRDTVQLRIRLDDGKLITASTLIIEPAFPQSPNNSTSSLNFEYNTNNNYTFNPGMHSAVYSVIMHIRIIELLPDGTNRTRTLPWTIARNTQSRRVQILGRDFYQFMANNLEPDPQIRRFFQGIDFEIVSGTQQVLDYLNIVQANLGITSSGEIPVYSNLSDGFGIVASRASTFVKNIAISPLTQDSLRRGVITKDLNFL